MNFKKVIKCLFYVSLFTNTSLLIGCASYAPAANKSLSPSDILSKNEFVVNSGQREIHIVMLKDKELATNYVGIDPRNSSIIPVFVKINNYSKDVVKVDFSGSSLSTDTGETYPPLTIEEAIEKVKISDDETVGWTLAFGLVGGLISGSNTASANKTLADDYHSKSFKPTLINTNRSGQGLVFFYVPAEKQDRINAAIIQLLHPLSHDAVKVTVNLKTFK